MKIFQVFNEQRHRGGDHEVVDATMRVLAQNGHEPRLVLKSSKILANSLLKRISAFWGGVYNVYAYREMRGLIEKEKPDLVHIHSVYPMFSPSVLVACRRSGVPVVMTVHSHGLTCPTWNHVYKGRVCEECVGGHEYRCVLKNCRNNIFESSGYALRSAAARRFRLFHDNVNMMIVMTPFARGRLLQAGFREDQIAFVPNPASTKVTVTNPSSGDYIAFAGRVSQEKGVDTFLAAAAQTPDVRFKVAGDGPLMSEMQAIAPPNVEFLGRLGPSELGEFYGKSRIVVVPSVCFEQCPLVILEAMARGLPIVASRIGGLPDIVDEYVTGSLFEPGDAVALAHELRLLWDDPNLCNRLGAAGEQKIRRKYTEDAYFRNLMAVYQAAILHSKNKAIVNPLVQISNAAQPQNEESCTQYVDAAIR